MCIRVDLYQNCFEKTPARHCPQLFFVDAVPEVVKPPMVDFLAAEFYSADAVSHCDVYIGRCLPAQRSLLFEFCQPPSVAFIGAKLALKASQMAG